MEELEERFLNPETLRCILCYMCRGMSRDPITDCLHTMLTTPIQFHLTRFGLGIFKGTAVLPFTLMTDDQRAWLFDLVNAIRTRDAASALGHSALHRLDDPLDICIENDRIFFLRCPPPPPPSTTFAASRPTPSTAPVESNDSGATPGAREITTKATASTASSASKPPPSRRGAEESAARSSCTPTTAPAPHSSSSSTGAHHHPTILISGRGTPQRRLHPRQVFDALLQTMAGSKHTTPDRLRLLLNILLQRLGCRLTISRETLMHVQNQADELFAGPGPGKTVLPPPH